MNRLSAPLYYPDQTSPDVYVSRQTFAAGQIAEATWHQWALAYVLNGDCRWRIGEHVSHLSAGDMILIKPFVTNGWIIDGGDSNSEVGAAGIQPSRAGMELVWTIFNLRPHWLFWLAELDFSRGGLVIHTVDREGINRDVTQASIDLADTFGKGGVRRDDWTLLALEKLLLTVATYSMQLQAGVDSRIRDAMDFIHTRFADPMVVSDIARVACLSPQRLFALFTLSVGAAPAQYLESVRLNHAAQMLRLGLANIEEIAKSSGYPDVPHFYRRFKLRYMMTPREYRLRYRENTFSAGSNRDGEPAPSGPL